MHVTGNTPNTLDESIYIKGVMEVKMNGSNYIYDTGKWNS